MTARRPCSTSVMGGVVIRGGYQPPAPAPPAAPPREPPRGGAAGVAVAAAVAAADARRARRRGTRSLGHRAVGHEEGRSRAEEARPQSGRRQRRQGLPELPREGSGRLRRADQQRQREESPPGRGRTARSTRRAVRATNWKTVWLDHISFRRRTTRSRRRSIDALLGWKPGRTRAARTSARSATSAASSFARRRRWRRCEPRPAPRRRAEPTAGAPRVDRSHLVRHLSRGIRMR